MAAAENNKKSGSERISLALHRINSDNRAAPRFYFHYSAHMQNKERASRLHF